MGILTAGGDVAIIGAGLAGASLALALHQKNIPCRIYESRSANAGELGSGVILTPNGLSVLDSIGVFERITARCWKSRYRTVKNDKDETTQKTLIANEELYGYENHRLYRQILLDEMKKMLAEQNISVTYNAKFEGITNEGPDAVTFLVNGRQEHAAILIGADGVYSSVRKYLSPDATLQYTGTIGVIAHINASTVEWPSPDYEKQTTIQGTPGALILQPEVVDASDIMIAKQAAYPDLSRAKLEEMQADRQWMCDFFREGYDEWGKTARSVIDSVCAHKETLYLWPFSAMPKLERWSSAAGRVIIVGDAAHAMPPSSGQGVNQALEDAYSLVLVLTSGAANQNQALQFWKDYRQERIDSIVDWATTSRNVERLPEAERKRLIEEGTVKDPSVLYSGANSMTWLYRPSIDKHIGDWLNAHGSLDN